MSDSREPRKSRQGPQGTQAFSRDQLSEVLQPLENDVPDEHRATLVLVSSEGGRTASGTRFTLDSDRMTIGRSTACDVRIEEPSISSEHARFVRAEDGWRIVNLLSTNGVFVNGQKVFSHRLCEGDEIRLGRTLLRFHDAAGAARSASGSRALWWLAAAVIAAAAGTAFWLAAA